MSTKISLLLPTRERPALAARFLASAAEYALRPDLVEAVLYVDEDDLPSHSLRCEGIAARTLIGPRMSMGGYNTACLKQCNGDIVVLTNDDVVIRTKGWDARLREMHEDFDDGIYMLYPNDLFKGKRLCSFPVLSRKTCEILGEPFPRVYRGSFIDYHLLDIFKRLQRRGHARLVYLPDVVFEHMHYRNGKNVFDETYRRRDRFGDDDTFLALRTQRSRATSRLHSEICRTKPSASAEPEEKARRGQAGLFTRLSNFMRSTLFDEELPWSWRGYLFVWFVGRALAAKGYLSTSRQSMKSDSEIL